MLELIDAHDQLDDVTGIKVIPDDISSFQKNVAESFVANLKNNISSRFPSQDVVSAFNVFNPQKMPDVSSSHLASYGEDSIDVLMNHYGAEKPAHTCGGERSDAVVRLKLLWTIDSCHYNNIIIPNTLIAIIIIII